MAPPAPPIAPPGDLSAPMGELQVAYFFAVFASFRRFDPHKPRPAADLPIHADFHVFGCYLVWLSNPQQLICQAAQQSILPCLADESATADLPISTPTNVAEQTTEALAVIFC